MYMGTATSIIGLLWAVLRTSTMRLVIRQKCVQLQSGCFAFTKMVSRRDVDAATVVRVEEPKLHRDAQLVAPLA